MNVTVEKNDLSKVIQLVQAAVAKRSTMPILSNLLISAQGKSLKISASDLELSAVAHCKAEVKSGGSTTVNAKIFSDLVRELPEGPVKLSLGDGERIEVVAKGSKFKVIGVSAEEYPTLPGLGCATTGRVSATTLLEMIQRTIFAVSHDETRFNLNGVCLKSSSTSIVGQAQREKSTGHDALRMVATDGHRLALITRPVQGLTFKGRVIVPRKGLAEIRRVLEAEASKEVGIGIVDGFFVLEATDFKMTCRLIDAEYPEYGQVLPQKRGVSAIIKGSEFAQALRRVMLMVSDREKGVRASFSPGTLRITSSSPELGEASEELNLNYGGEVLSVGFNALYLLDITAALGEDQDLVLELHGELGPGKFYSANDESCIGIVMPMRL